MGLTGRRLQLALRCKLVTGSYEGKTRDCECIGSAICEFGISENVSERIKYTDEEKIQKQIDENHEEYQKLQKGLENGELE